jgi:hypothetical protein
MPLLAILRGLTVYVYYADHNPPHVHGFHAGQEVLIEIRTGGILRGSLPPTELRHFVEWVAPHREELVHAWYLASTQQTPPRMPDT